MTSANLDLPAGWTETADDLFDREAYVLEVGDSRRIVAGLSGSSSTGPVELRVSAVDDDATINRHDFLVDEYDDERTARERLTSFMRLVSDSLSDGTAPDTSLVLGVQDCIEAFTDDGGLLSFLRGS